MNLIISCQFPAINDWKLVDEFSVGHEGSVFVLAVASGVGGRFFGDILPPSTHWKPSQAGGVQNLIATINAVHVDMFAQIVVNCPQEIGGLSLISSFLSLDNDAVSRSRIGQP